MSASTNQLVATLKRSVLIPSAIASVLAVGTVLFVNHNDVHAASTVTTSPLDDHSVAALTSLDQAMETLAAHVTPSVVNIAVTSRAPEQPVMQQEGDDQSQGQGQMQNLPPQLQQFFGQFGGGMPFGGGGQAAPQQPQYEHGYIITNDHVVDGATQIRVTLHDRRVLPGKVVGVDKLTDLAVVKVDAHNLPAISWGDSSKLEPGQTVLAFGSPFGYFQFSVTRGIVSAVNRENPYRNDARKPGGYIQTDAAINPGNSGGALVDSQGQLIGINTFIISNSGSFAGAGFAIPSQIARSVSQQIIAHGKVDHGYLGISLNDVTPDNARFFDLKDASGAIVAQVTPDSPASQGGLQQGDVIESVNGQKITNSEALQVAVTEVQPGTHLSVGIMRNGQPLTENVTVGEYHGGNQQLADASGDGSTQKGKLGLAVTNITPDARQQMQIPDSVHGVVVQNVRPNSPADDAGLQPGDVILQVNRKPITSANQFVSDVQQSPEGKDLLFLVWTKGGASYLTIPGATQSGE
jgi:serine protease Do